MYSTKPSSCVGKQGSAGTTIQLSANYFRLLKRPEYEFNMYQVTFEPNIDSDAMRKSFVRKLRDQIGGHLYDGANTLYMTRRLPAKIVQDCESREGTKYKVIVQETDRVVSNTDFQSMQVMNLILKQAMGGLDLQLVGRNLYDALAKVRGRLKVV